MPGYFNSPEGDLERIFVDDYAMIDQYAKTGSLWAWGHNAYGQLGDNAVSNKSSPVQTVAGGTNWKQVVCGPAFQSHTAAIKTDGTLWVWGTGSGGQLGDNTTVGKSSPVQTVAAGTNWNRVAVGSNSTAAIKTDGTLWTWGTNSYGKLGDDTVANTSSPVQTIAGGTNWNQVASGYHHTSSIKTDGTLWTWGRNTDGQLGDNTTTHKSSPVQTVAGGTNWKQVACGGSHTSVVKTDGTLWVWGRNTAGELGDNTNVNKSSPIQTIAGGTNWKQVACGFAFTAAIKTDGTLWLWGNNYSGNLGDNTRTITSSPIQTIAGGTSWKQVSCGSSESAAIKTDGTLWTWGNNNRGGLGNNTVSNKSSPVQTVAGGTNWKQVAVGPSYMAAIHFYDAGNLYPSA